MRLKIGKKLRTANHIPKFIGSEYMDIILFVTIFYYRWGYLWITIEVVMNNYYEKPNSKNIW